MQGILDRTHKFIVMGSVVILVICIIAVAVLSVIGIRKADRDIEDYRKNN